jgi:dTDP-glucose 4,6-dehydratase
MKKIFLIGGGGFIGSNLVLNLQKKYKIIICDNFSRNAIKNYKFLDNVQMITLDILNANFVELFKNHQPNIIIHLAAIAGVDNVLKNPVKTMEVNMIGTYLILKAIVDSGIKINKFINFSTSEVYGEYSYKLEEDKNTTLGTVDEARWSYSVSKLAGEHLCFSYFKQFKIPVISIRPFNIYGPNQVGEGAIQIFLKKCLKNDTIEIHGDGSQIRSWCYIDDAIDFIFKCIESKKVIGQILNMGNPEGTITTIGLAKKIIDITKSKSKIKFTELKYSDIELRIPNINKAKKILKYQPKVSLDDGLKRTFEWFKNAKENE